MTRPRDRTWITALWLIAVVLAACIGQRYLREML